MFELQLKILTPGAKPFKVGRLEDAGYDLFSVQAAMIYPGGSALLKLGIATAFTPGYVGLVFDRSSIGVRGGMRRAGVIDSGYRGEWMVSLYNSNPNEALIVESVLKNPQAKAVAQVVFVPYIKACYTVVDELPDSLRAEGGFGSTD